MMDTRSNGCTPQGRRGWQRSIAASVLAVINLTIGMTAGCSTEPSQRPPATSSSTQATPGPLGGTSTPATTGPSSPPTSGATASARGPSPGSTSETVSSRPQKSAAPVALGNRARFGSGLSTTVTPQRSRYVKADLPGQVSGPAVVLEVAVANSSDTAVDLNSTVVTVEDDRSTPGEQITSSPARRLPASVAPGQRVEWTYVFVVPEARRDPITVQVTISADLAVVTARGSVR
jgi:hypothetical protein